MTDSIIVFVEANATAGRRFLQSARQLGMEPVLLAENLSRYNYVTEDYLAKEGIETISVETSNYAAVLEVCDRLRSTREIAAVLSAEEVHYATAASVARSFSLPGPDPAAVEQCRDKFAQRRLLSAAGLASPKYRFAASPTDAREKAAEIGFPVIVKPRTGTGSIGVNMCGDGEAVAKHTAAVLQGYQNSVPKKKPARRSLNSGVLIEEYLTGPQYAVQTIGGQVLGIVAQYISEPPDFVLYQHCFPAELEVNEQAAIINAANCALKALGLNWGPAHTEVRLTERGPVTIEVNPRIAGGYIPRLVHLASGIDVIAETVKLAIGQKPNCRPDRIKTTGVRFLTPEQDGLIMGLHGIERAHSIPGVVEVALDRRCGTDVVRRGDSGDRIGHVIATATNIEQTIAVLR